MNIFISCSLTNIKLRNSDLYIARLYTSYWVEGEHSSDITYIESDSPQENSLNALDQFNLKVNNFKRMYPNEVFSRINIKRTKYRGFEVFTSLDVNNLIKSNKGI